MTILPSCPFPNTHWLSLANASETLLLDTLENYPKQTFRNRFDILGPNGKQSLSIPVHRPSGVKTPIFQIEISYGTWVNTHLGAIRSAYGKSAYFEHFFDDIQNLYHSKPTLLVDFNSKSLNIIRNVLFKNRNIAIVDESPPFELNDLRLQFDPSFIAPSYPKYPQVFSDRFDFVNNLSGLDLVFNMGPKAIDYILLKKNG